MTMLDLSTARWRKSSRSTNTSNCVEVAFTGQAVAVRDSKHPHGGALALPAPAWAGFLTNLRHHTERSACA
ncbi:MAG: DUF397 domain-containing protein [Sciscionella sp.]